jgi:nucleotide-binding universal stress UspA family protein
MFKQILVAVDDSQTGAAALQVAIGITKKFDAKLRIVHAVDITNINRGTEFPDYPDGPETVDKHGQDILRGAETIATAAGLAADTHLITIDSLTLRVPEAIAAYAEAWPADLIVVGTHGRRGLNRLFLGSVAEGIARIASKPVLLVRGQS